MKIELKATLTYKSKFLSPVILEKDIEAQTEEDVKQLAEDFVESVMIFKRQNYFNK